MDHTYEKLSIRSIGLQLFNDIPMLIINTVHIYDAIVKLIEKVPCKEKYIVGAKIDLDKYKILKNMFDKYIE